VKVCPDTNCWIERLVSPNPWHEVDGGEGEETRHAHILLTTIVLQELWAGARVPDQRAYAERLYEAARRSQRLLTPSAAAWILSGKALQILARRGRFSSARLRALRNDVLLAATALVHGAAVMTKDRVDFARIAEVLPVRVVTPGGEA
jgi:predicted nucleic acid-binding protein